VKILNPVDGERITNVFYASTHPISIGRFVTGLDGEPLATNRRKRWVPNGRGGKKIEIIYDRLEVWECRPWVAIATDTGEVVARSSLEGVADRAQVLLPVAAVQAN
jgi:hypothetical protein